MPRSNGLDDTTRRKASRDIEASVVFLIQEAKRQHLPIHEAVLTVAIQTITEIDLQTTENDDR